MTGGGRLSRPFLLGLTGNIACGKSTVLARLGERGAATIDADEVYHDLIVPDAPLWHALRKRFGSGVIAADRSLDRRGLADIVFADATALADLDRLTHPSVVAELRRRVGAAPSPFVVVDAVKLYESGFAADCDAVWLITCRPDQQVDRLMARNGLQRPAAERRVAAQPSLAETLSRADAVIANDGSVDETRSQVDRALAKLEARRGV